MDQAKNWQEFREACLYSYAPSENMVWADTRGNIGWQATGIVPRRSGWNGLLPVPGDGRFEWDGYLPVKELPYRLNPLRGFWQPQTKIICRPGIPTRLVAFGNRPIAPRASPKCCAPEG